MSDIKLKPCPFCGGKAYYYYQRENDSIVCEECGATLTYFDFGEDAQKELLKQWNIRPIEDALRAENKRLKKELAYINKEGISDFSSLISNAQRFREALVTICAIYEINGAEWRFDKRLYEVAKKALEGKDD